MRGLTQSLLILLAATLSLWLVLGFLSLEFITRLFLSALLLLLTGGGLWWQRRGRISQQSRAESFAEGALPPEAFSGAIVMVCGDSQQLFSVDKPFRESRQGWYLQVSSPEQLPLLAEQLAEKRPALISQIAILLAVVPEEHQDTEYFTQRLRVWHRAIVACRSVFSGTPPLLTAGWLNRPCKATSEQASWFTLIHECSEVQVSETANSTLPLRAWNQEASVEVREARICLTLWLNCALSWSAKLVENSIGLQQSELPALKVYATGWAFTSVNAVANNLWQQHFTALTQLKPLARQASELLPLPDLLLACLPTRRGITRQMKAYRVAGLLCGCFLLLAMAASWRNNQKVILNISDHLALYQSLSGIPPEPKIHAQKLLYADVQQLDEWQRTGEPLQLGLGLYQGMRLIAPIHAAIGNWASPTPEASVIQQVIQQPLTTRLDSLSLFEPGNWRLKPGSTKVLVNALVSIRAKPGWLIVVSGHTDTTGNTAENQKLSIRRAESIRNWMRDTGDLPESCFAVQGYGESRPVATNDTTEGRALNRRVEISLVPQADACRVAGVTSPLLQDGDGSENQMEK